MTINVSALSDTPNVRYLVALYLTIGREDDSNMLQEDLDRLSVCESGWDMDFNHSKCQVGQVTTSRKTSKFSYMLYGHVL